MTDTDTSREEAAISALLSYGQADMDGVLVTTSRQAIHEVVDAYRALRDELDAARSERVKPLEWEDLGDRCHRAKAPLFGSIRAEAYGSGVYYVNWSVPGYCDTFVEGGFGSLKAAKAAAQADYERRILSALTPATSEWNAAIEAAANIAIQGYSERQLKGDRYALGVQAGVKRMIDALKRPEHEGESQ